MNSGRQSVSPARKLRVNELGDAVANCDFAALAQFASDGVDFNEPYYNGELLLHSAIELGYDNVAEFLIEHGADPDAVAEDASTAISVAIESDFDEMIRILVRYGADVKRRIVDSYSYLDLACERRCFLSAVVLMDLGLTVDDCCAAQIDDEASAWLRYVAPALYAAKYGDFERLETALEDGADPDTIGHEPLLVTAARRGDLQQVRLLIAAGANPDETDTRGQETALMAAAMFHNADIVRDLIRAGANVNQAMRNGITALTRASEQGFGDLVADLIAAGARSDIGRSQER